MKKIIPLLAFIVGCTALPALAHEQHGHHRSHGKTVVVHSDRYGRSYVIEHGRRVYFTGRRHGYWPHPPKVVVHVDKHHPHHHCHH